ncbi:Putative uncharacterized protein [Taphrina deformans PYCC 5710]|uniref:Uncharacterized protein n=1 Tax=Taphrina deformans (strain PYCC 5710 / ATCC 11124 / CBS 356.35 / IMI 108563 / JCM 9778 / NBRC 8474) TaxID=1097556 RepID=R4X6T6_TAPDE|nr:Putative uncharacterized protein [Taphrina deformans PYCC 5710]|eukprot:CCG80651.1 Putative uncharacterized protein [Taphrina deformans PYCC 5710]
MDRLAQIRLQSSSKNHNQGQLGVVLGAIEDTIKASDSPLNPTSYFASLLALLETCVSGNDITNAEVAYSSIYLLDAIAPETPTNLLSTKFTQILNLLVPLLNAEEAATVRSATGVLESLLKAQTLESWRTSPTVQALKSLLVLGLDARPKVRRRAIESVCNVLASAPQSLTKDSIPAIIVAEELLKSASSQIKQSERGSLLHTLQLIKSVAGTVSWPVAYVDQLCDLLLKGVADLGEGFVTVIAFEVFEKVFEQGTNDVDLARLQRLLKTIIDFKPSDKDANVLPPWLNVVARGFELYAGASPENVLQDVASIYKTIFPFLQSDMEAVRRTCSDCLQSLITTCLPTRKSSPAAQAIVTTTLRGLNSGARYRAARTEIFELVRCLFNKLKSKANPILMESLNTLAETRSHVQDKSKIDSVLGAAIQAVGPEPFFKVLPLNLTSDAGRAWLLPVLRDNVQNTNLSFFVKELIPLSESFYPKSEGAEVDNKIFKTVIDQIWTSLPGFCDLPLDLPTALTTDVAEIFANVLYKQPDLRSTICNALQNLCLKPQQLIDCELSDAELTTAYQYNREKAKTSLKHMHQFAPNFIAVLFNVYAQTLPQYRNNILETIKGFLTIASPKDIQDSFAKVLTTLAENLDAPASGANSSSTEGMPPAKHTAMDLIIAFVPHLSSLGIEMVWEIFGAQATSDDVAMQKKAYKIFNAMSSTDLGLKFLTSRVPQIQAVLLKTKNVGQSVRKDRLAALINMVNLIPKNDLHFIPAILSEAVLCTKEQNEKARTMAFDLLVLMGQRMDAGGNVRNSLLEGMQDLGDAEANIQEFFVMVQAGLGASTPHMVSASVTALARLLFEFMDKLDGSFVEEMLETMEPILDSKNREVARSCLGFYKVVVISLPLELVASRLESLVAHLMGWSHEHSRDFKSKVKHLIERMVRRFGFDQIERHIPEADKKLLTNIRKTQERRKRNKRTDEADGTTRRTGGDAFEDAMQESDESESDVEEEQEEETSTNRRKGRGREDRNQKFIQNTDEPMDLLDRSAMAQVSSTNPNAMRRQKPLPSARSNYKTDEDGKYIFNGKENDEERGDVPMGGSGMGAMMEARQGMKKNSKGRVKFSNKRARDDEAEDHEMPDVEEKRQRTDRPMRPKQEAPHKKLFQKGKGGSAKQGASQKAGGRKTRK